MPEELSIGPVDLEWLGGALKLDALIPDKPALEELLRTFPAIRLARWPAGQEVISEGASGRDFYVLYDGRLSVWRKSGSATPRKVGELKAGDFFGEIGFLMKSPRSATVRVEEPCRVFKLPAEEFASILTGHKMLERWVKNVACERLAKLFAGD